METINTPLNLPSLQMLEKGCSQYHRPVLRLLYEYLKLQDPKSREMRELGESIMTVVSQHIKVGREGRKKGYTVSQTLIMHVLLRNM